MLPSENMLAVIRLLLLSVLSRRPTPTSITGHFSDGGHETET